MADQEEATPAQAGEETAPAQEPAEQQQQEEQQDDGRGEDPVQKEDLPVQEQKQEETKVTDNKTLYITILC